MSLKTDSKLPASGSPPELPFELVPRPDGTWRSYWREQKLFIVVSGTEEGPLTTLRETLCDAISRWTELREAVTAYVRALPRDRSISLEPNAPGGFAAGSCGFDEELVFSAIAVRSATSPRRVLVTFYTGFPDGYATYEVALDDGSPTSIRAFAS